MGGGDGKGDKEDRRALGLTWNRDWAYTDGKRLVEGG